MEKYQFELSSGDGNVLFAKTNVNGFRVEFQGHNSYPVDRYTKVTVSRNGKVLLVKNNIVLDHIFDADVDRYIKEALKQG